MKILIIKRGATGDARTNDDLIACLEWRGFLDNRL